MNIKLIVSYINIIRLIPHIVVYLRNKNVYKEDIISNYRGPRQNMFNSFITLLVFKKEFRNIFYHRIGRISVLFKWMLTPYETFVLDNQMVIGGGFVPVILLPRLLTQNR